MADSELELATESKITVTYREEARFAVTERDWTRLRKRISDLKRLERSWAAIAWFALGGFVSVGLGALAWIQPYFGLDNSGRVAYVWIWVALAILGGAFAVGAALGFAFTADVRRSMKVSVDQVLDDMDEIHTVVVV